MLLSRLDGYGVILPSRLPQSGQNCPWHKIWCCPPPSNGPVKGHAWGDLVACTSQILGHSGGDKNTKLCFLSSLQILWTVLKRMQCIGHLGKEWEKCKTPVHLSPSFLSPELLLLNHLKWNQCTQKEMLVKKTPLVSPVGRKKETCDLRRNQWIKWRHTLGVAWEAGRLQAQEFGESVARPGPVLQPLFSTLSVPHCSAHLYEANFQQSAELQFHSLSYVRRAQSSADKKKDVTRGVKGNSFRDTNRTQDVFLAGKHGIYSGLFTKMFLFKNEINLGRLWRPSEEVGGGDGQDWQIHQWSEFLIFFWISLNFSVVYLDWNTFGLTRNTFPPLNTLAFQKSAILRFWCLSPELWPFRKFLLRCHGGFVRCLFNLWGHHWEVCLSYLGKEFVNLDFVFLNSTETKTNVAF